MIVSIIIFLLMFCLIVISHEFGHYIIGKKNGIHATEFFIGVGPKLFGWKRDETEFSVRLLPFGGACVFEGQDDLADSKDESGDGTSAEPSEGSFLNAPVWGRFATTLAGPLMNVLLAYVCGVVLAATCGEIIPEIASVVEESAAEEAGLQVGDIITEINGHNIHLSSEVSFMSYCSDGRAMSITVKRGDEEIEYTVHPKYDENDKRYYIGITNGKYIDCTGLKSFQYGFYNVEYILRATLQSLKMFFTKQAGLDDLSGPVGIVKVVDDTYDEAKSYGFLSVLLSMINITMLLSANLAVINLLPIPAMDGGRLVFLLIEAIRGKPIPPEKEGYVHLAGMALLLVLVVVVLLNDITKFFR